MQMLLSPTSFLSYLHNIGTLANNITIINKYYNLQSGPKCILQILKNVEHHDKKSKLHK